MAPKHIFLVIKELERLLFPKASSEQVHRVQLILANLKLNQGEFV